MSKLIILRHGESQWNLENRFTGWVDVDLSPKGIEEAKLAGQVLQEKGVEFQHTFTSYLKRSIKTHFYTLEQMDRLWLPVTRSWRLNERHYGALQGLDKDEMIKQHGAEQVKIWRRSFDTPPPSLAQDSVMNPAHDLRYKNLPQEAQPLFESLELTIKRVLPIWSEEIKPKLLKNENVLVVAHGNSLRGLVKEIKQISNDDILELNIPTGKPWLFEFDAALKLIDDKYL